MPIYEFRCNDCSVKFEKIRKFSDPNAECPQCGKVAERLLSVPAPAIVQGGTHAQRDSRSRSTTLGEFPDHNEWIDA